MPIYIEEGSSFPVFAFTFGQAFISTPSSIHFTCFIVNFEGNNLEYNLKSGTNYLHDGCNNDGEFVEVDDLFNKFETRIKYILIYKLNQKIIKINIYN